jgi:hypothetical protein
MTGSNGKESKAAIHEQRDDAVHARLDHHA